MEKALTETEFNNLFNQYYEEMCRVIYPILKNSDEAQDLVQDVFVTLWLRRHELHHISSFKGYLYKAVVFKALDSIRKQKNTQRVTADLKVIHGQDYTGADDKLAEKDLEEAVHRCLDSMPENMKLIFQLSRFSSLKNREIAEQLRISLKTVESNMTKALKLLHEHLQPFLKDKHYKLLVCLLLRYFN